MLVALHAQMKDVFRAIEKIAQDGAHGSCTLEAGWSESRGVGYLILAAATARRANVHRGNPLLDFCEPICMYLFPRLP